MALLESQMIFSVNVDVTILQSFMTDKALVPA